VAGLCPRILLCFRSGIGREVVISYTISMDVAIDLAAWWAHTYRADLYDFGFLEVKVQEGRSA
jgi:hypothetical protein